MIKLNGIRKIYKTGDVETHALNGIDLEIKDGEFVSIVGASGSGKSTLLNILGGMDTATEGTYTFDDVDVTKLSQKDLHLFRKDNVSFIFQSFALMPHYTVYENVEIPLLAKNVAKKDRKNIIMEKLTALGIDHLAKKLPSQISGGEQQRCAIARALVAGGKLILADEPTGALDKNTGQAIMDALVENHKNGKTLVVITHDENVASRAERIIRIEDGKVK